MPSAQGHITVRRRAQDGTDGSDAVRYWVIPSATQVKRAQDGTMYPNTVTCEKRKQSGDSAPVVTSEGILYYQIGYNDGSMTTRSAYGSSGIKVTSTMAWIKFMLDVSQVQVASETVSIVADGKGVSSVKEWYLRSTKNTGVKKTDSGWQLNTVPQLTDTYKYLWNYEEIVLTDGATIKTPASLIGVYGRGIKSVTNYYLATTASSGVTTSTEGWTTGIQSPTPDNRYLWNYEIITYDDDSTTVTAPHIICVYGQKGDPGNGVESVTVYYMFTAGREPGISDSDWKTMAERKAAGMMTEPNDTYPYMWKKTVTKWTNGTTTNLIELFSRKPSDGKQGIQGCIYRRSRFATGFEFHNDSELNTDGLRYIDLAYLMSNSSIFASKAKWFRCRKTHTSNSSNAPQLTSDGTESWLEYWEPLNSLEPTYTPFLMADDAIITLMQSNQLLIENDEGVITAGLSGSNSGKKIRIWAGAATPDNAPFRVDVTGAFVATKANITGTINANDGKIAGFNISGNSLTNGPDFNNDACIIFRNDTHHTFAGIGGNVLPSTSGLKAVARFENEDYNNFWGLGRNIAMLLSAKHGDINHAFIGSGNGNLDGWISGYKYSKFNLSSSNTIYNGYLKISENNVWVVYAYSSVSGSGVVLPKLSEVRTALGISDSQQFCIPFTIVADLFSNNFYVYGRNSIEDSNKNKPWNVDDIPVFTHWDGARWDRLEMGKGDALTVLLIYEPSRTGSLDNFSVKYTARVLSLQNK